MAFDQTLLRGTTSKIIEIVMRDATTGQGLTGVNAVNLTAYYVLEGGTATAHTQPANGLPGATYNAGVWAEVDSTNMPGVYQFHLDNALFSGAQDSATLYLTYTGALNKIIRFCVLDADLRDATSLGLTRLDDTISSRSTLAATDIITGPAIDTILLNGKGAVERIGAMSDAAGNAMNAPLNFSTLLIGSTTAGAIDRVTLVDTCTANSDMRGTNGANTVAPDNSTIATIDTNVASIIAGTSPVTANDVTVASFNAAALEQFATLNTTAVSADIVAGSVIQLMQDEVTLVDATQAGLAKFANTDTGETAAASGSVAALAQGSAGGNVTVGDITQTALAKFANTDTGETTAATGSVAALSQGSGGGGSVQVGGFDTAALLELVNNNTGATAAAAGSVAALSKADVSALATSTNVSDSTSTIQTDISNLNDLTATQVENAVWDAQSSAHTASGTMGKLLDTIKKSNLSVDGTVAGTPTSTQFDSGITGYGTGAFNEQMLVFLTGNCTGQSRGILSFDATNGTFTFEEPFVGSILNGDEFVILPYHVHPISEIQAGLATTSDLAPLATSAELAPLATSAELAGLAQSSELVPLARTTDLATVIKTGQSYTATAQSGDTIDVTLS